MTTNSNKKLPFIGSFFMLKTKIIYIMIEFNFESAGEKYWQIEKGDG